MITVIDLNICNVASVANALKHFKIDHIVTDRLDEIQKGNKFILPGVGNFCEAAKRLKVSGIASLLRKKVIEEKNPLLGICLGMQLLASYGEEGGGSEGLDFIKAKISYLRSSKYNLRVPHVGWNDVSFSDMPIFDSLENKSCFYFVHSFEMVVQEPIKVAYSNYGVDFAAAVQKDNIVGVQFHPEKSQRAGLTLLENFAKRM